ncbi:MAG: DCC1-like thiol-disulfide oxidoreductase family protein [Planctomycetota bacterium]
MEPLATASGGDSFDVVYYDGGCGLCHRSVRFLLPRDRGGARFRFAPIGGQTFGERVSEAERAGLPDSIVVLTAGGDLLTRSEAVLHVLGRLGGGWGVLAKLGRVVPRGLRDWGYDRVAAARHRFFAKPAEACPIVPPEQRERFLP